MTPNARIQISIDLLDEILQSWNSEKRIPADKIIDRFFRSQRFIGSKDRAYVGELVYWVLRNLAMMRFICPAAAHLGEGRMLILAALIYRGEYTLATLRDACDGSKYAPHTITPNEKELLSYKAPGEPPSHVRLNYPEWLEPELKKSLKGEFEEALAALNEQAATDVRVNTLKTTREELLASLNAQGFSCEAAPTSPVGIRLKKRAPIFTAPEFKDGHFEVQDEGSQMVAGLTDAKPGMKVIDFCAGAGGKTLAIAAQMKNKGRLLAWDVSEKRLKQIKERLKRAGVDNVQTHVLESENDGFVKRHKASADRVLVDAPCSGTGTWRRNPDLKWRFTQADLDEVVTLQESILQSASRLVAPGGRLIYATCSILSCENDRQVEKFLENNDNFRVVCAKKIWDNIGIESKMANRDDAAVSYLSVAPHQDGVDGFFAAVLERVDRPSPTKHTNDT
ncbi:MAG: RsmB/NOP family class I SAM-dependent RNA methyltransferase [Alphaproteobacteria bacterium]|nr:RsmB/NOP family class I SAM-dependent RNA methyltransferase [Alphaproteobacteria bacterium]